MKTAQQWSNYYQTTNLLPLQYNGNDLGMRCDEHGTQIKLWSPVAEQATLRLYRDGEPDTKPYWSEPMIMQSDGVWSYASPEDLNGIYYDFSLVIDGEVVSAGDPYARTTGVNGHRAMIVDLLQTNPAGWELDHAPVATADTIIDEIHIKEFSSHNRGGWPEAVRGKYLAFTYPETSLDGKGELPTGVAYLKKLGITHVQIMPMYDYGSVDEDDGHQFNWGYDPVNYNVPEGSYATDPHHGEVRITELKQMVQSLHQQGFRVVMDVVYNHTYNLDNPLQQTMPYYYYRTDANGNLSNGSGCGNDIATERPMAHKFIVDSVLYWAREYHIDGFRFDLMGLLDVDLMKDIRERLDQIYGKGEKLIYGEPWAAGLTASMAPLTDKSNLWQLDENIGMFSDDTRDTIKGSASNHQAVGFVNGESYSEHRLLAAVRAWCIYGSSFKAPSQVINYVSVHDNQTLWDKLTSTTPDEALRRRQYRLAVAIYLTCLGRPLMLSGESFWRTKDGNDNSHNAPIELNQLDWSAVEQAKDLFEYYRGLIALRKRLSGLCDKSNAASSRINSDWVAPGLAGFKVDNRGGDNAAMLTPCLLIVYNRERKDQDIILPSGKWRVLADDTDTWQWQKSPRVVEGHAMVNQVGWMILGTYNEADN